MLIADFVRNLGFAATAHTPTATGLDLDQVALGAGLVAVRGGKLRAPFLAGGFALAVVSTDMQIAADGPLACRAGPSPCPRPNPSAPPRIAAPSAAMKAAP